MKVKLDKDGHVVVQDNFPVWVADDGKEIPYDVPRLINDLSRVNSESAGRRKDIDELNVRLKAFEGLDPEKAKEAMTKVADMDAGKLMDLGKVEELKANIERGWSGKVADLKKALSAKVQEAADKLSAKDEAIRNLTIKGAFKGSDFLKNSTYLTPDIAYAYFGKNFEVREDNGELRIVATLNGQPVFSRKNPGNPASTEEAIEEIINSYPGKENILRPVPGGSGAASGNNGNGNGVKTISRGDTQAFGNNLEAIAKGEISVI